MQKFDFGEAIGIIVWKSWYPALIHGHHNYATTYDFPVRLKFIENFRAPKEEGLPPGYTSWNLPEYIKMAKELESEGVAAISTNCGLTGSLQERLVNSVNIPVFTSSLLQVPHVHRMLGKNKKVGILTDSSEYLKAQDNSLLRSCGIDESIPVVIYGMFESEWKGVWNTQFKGLSGMAQFQELSGIALKPGAEYNPKKVGNALANLARKMVSENPDIGAIVLECTEMPIYAAAVRQATGLLVFDSSTQVRYIYHAIVKREYY